MDNDPSITNLQRNRKASIRADKNNILRYAVDIKGKTIQAILLPKVLRPWIIASTHEFSGHQGDQRLYNKIRGTFFWNGMKNNICQAIANCKVCKMESPNLGRYMNLHLEIGTAPMHFLAMDMIEIRNTRSPYQYVFTLIDMLTNYVFAIPVKDISGKTLIHKYIYKVYLPFRWMRNFCQIMVHHLSMKIGRTWPKHLHSNTFTPVQEIPEQMGRLKTSITS